MPTPRVHLTKIYIEAAKRTPATGRIEIRDAEVRGLLLRISEFGYKSFSLCARFPGMTNPSRRSIGERRHDQPGPSPRRSTRMEGTDQARC